MSLPATGTLYYNGHLFSSFADTSVSIRPRPDEAGWTNTVSDYHFRVRDYITDSSATDSKLNTLRAQLLAYGKELNYDAKGMGSPFKINAVGSQSFDAAWGPKPLSLTYTPRGNNLGAKIEWECQGTYADCDASGLSPTTTRNGVPMAFNYDVSWSISDEGMSTRTISGYVEIALTRGLGNERKVFTTADTLREQVTPAPLPNFKRNHQFHMSKDRRRLDFTFTDTEMDYPLPEGIVKMPVRQSVRSGPGLGFVKWFVTLSGSVVVAPGQPKILAAAKIGWLVEKRINAGTFLNFALAEKGAGKAGVNGLMMTSMEFSEGIFDRVTDFSITYVVFRSTSLQKLLSDTGMWQPVIGADGAGKWQSSLKNSVFNPRGAAGLEFDTSDDVIVDICGGFDEAEIGIENQTRDIVKVLGGKVANNDVEKKPAPENSWLFYNCSFTLQTDAKKVVHKPLNGAVGAAETNWGQVAMGAVAGALGTVKPVVAAVKAVRPDIVQRVAAPTCRLVCFGEGSRLGYKVPTPRVASVGGIECDFDGGDQEQKIIGSANGVNIYYSKWEYFYIMASPPKGPLPAPNNPALNTQDDTSNVGDK